MVDIHSHILWGVDDGADDLAQSLAMMKLAAETGTTDIVATPHSDSQFRHDPSLAETRIAELAEASQGRPRIHKGCEVYLSIENIEHCLDEPSRFTIGGLQYLLVEFHNAFVPAAIDEVLRQFLRRGLIPVVAHPERNPQLRDDGERLRRWIEMGCLLQVTAQSLTDRFGKSAQRSAWNLLRRGMVHTIASDGHDTEQRPPRLDAARDILTERMGADVAAILLVENPSAIVAGEPLAVRPAPTLPAPKKKWFHFGR